MEFNESKLKQVAEQYGLRLIILFGSRVSDSAYAGSDFDIAYLAERTLSLERESRLIVDLASIIGSDAIDLVNIRQAPPLLLYAITRSGLVLYAADSTVFPSLAAYAFKRYVEAKPLFELKLQHLAHQLQ